MGLCSPIVAMQASFRKFVALHSLLYIISRGTCAQIGKRQIPGVRMSQVFKLLAQQATELGAYKLARTVHAKLNTLKVMKSPPPIVALVVVLLAFVPP